MSWNLYCFSLLGISVSLTAVCLFGIEALGGPPERTTLAVDPFGAVSVSGFEVASDRLGRRRSETRFAVDHRVERLAGDAK